MSAHARLRRTLARLARPGPVRRCLLALLVAAAAAGCSASPPAAVTPLPLDPTLDPAPPASVEPTRRPTLVLTPLIAVPTLMLTPTPHLAQIVPTPQPGVSTIQVGDYYFSPAVVTVTLGTTVRWTPVGNVTHTIVPRDPPGAFHTGYTHGTGSPDFVVTFTQPGTYSYFCDYHPGEMDAVLIVSEEG